jgi:hypothetical protein
MDLLLTSTTYIKFFYEWNSNRMCVYVCMYKGGPKTGPCTTTFNDLLCFPF